MSQSKIIGLGIFVVAIMCGTVVFVRAGNDASKPAPSTDTTVTYSMDDIAKHSSTSDCWAVVNGGVYNLTSWIAQHPGGPEAISSLCGKDGSKDFNEQHGGQRRPEQALASFKIGTVK